MQQRFACIEAHAGKKKGDTLDLHNEIKVITCSDDTYALWSELISSHAQGQLIDVDSSDLRMMKDKPSWNAAKDGAISREFFKWLGNLSEDDHRKMLLHILNRSGPKRTQKWPKVVVKKPNSVLDNCYSEKEWVERRKRKQLVRKELNKIQPNFAFFDVSGNFRQERWKQFKKDFHVTSATMRVLLDQPGDNFFSEAKMLRSKNKKTEQLSPYAKAFFTKFLEKRATFEEPFGAAYIRKYNAATNVLGPWPTNSWPDNAHVRLGVIDFRFLPGYGRRNTSGVLTPFFNDFFTALKSGGMPGITQPDVWIWICGDHEAEVQAYAEAGRSPWIENYEKCASSYVQGKYERLCDCPPKCKTLKEPVRLLWLTQREGVEVVNVRDEFKYPEHIANTIPRKYREFDLRVNNGEFTMQFYFDILGMLCRPGDVVFNAFGGSKLLIAAVVTILNSYPLVVFLIAHNQLHSS